MSDPVLKAFEEEFCVWTTTGYFKHKPTQHQLDGFRKGYAIAEQASAARIAQLESDLAEARKDVERKTLALEKIAKWHDEFPPSCRFYEDGTQMSFGAAFGSNGQRDYMRGVAQLAIDAAIKEQGK